MKLKLMKNIVVNHNLQNSWLQIVICDFYFKIKNTNNQKINANNALLTTSNIDVSIFKNLWIKKFDLPKFES